MMEIFSWEKRDDMTNTRLLDAMDIAKDDDNYETMPEAYGRIETNLG
jgi:hypothetical protein